MNVHEIRDLEDGFDDVPEAGVSPFVKLFSRWEHQPWRALDVNLETDRATWQRLPSGLRAELHVAICELGAGDVSVTRLLLPLIEHAPDESWRLYLATQLSDEARHAIFFGRYYDEILSGQAPSNVAVTNHQEFDDSAYKTDFAPLLARSVAAAGESAASWHYASTMYHLVTEGVLGVAILKIGRSLGRNPRLLPGLAEGVAAVFRDESRHITFGRRAAMAALAQGHGDTIAEAYVTGIQAAARVMVGPSRAEVPLVGLPAYQRAQQRRARLADAGERAMRQAQAIGLPVTRRVLQDAWNAARDKAVVDYAEHWGHEHSLADAAQETATRPVLSSIPTIRRAGATMSSAGFRRSAVDGTPDVEHWLAVAARTSWIPLEHARYDLPATQACAQLMVPRATLDALLVDGMPSALGSDGQPLLDAHDVFNVALDAGWRRAVPVVGFRSAMRWLAAPIDELVTRRQWQVSIAGPQPAEVSELLIAVPDPERHGGCYVDAHARRAGPSADGVERVRIAADETLRGRATVRGNHTPIRAPEIRRAVDDLLGADLRWAKVPLTLQRCSDAIERLGYTTCVSTSARIATRLSAEGFEVTTHRGWLMGALANAHSWIEVRDEDGCVKVVDPILVLLRRRLEALERTVGSTLSIRGIPAPELLADGLLVNRVLSTTASYDSDLAVDASGTGRFVVSNFRPTTEDHR